MTIQWHYSADGSQQKGPLSEGELQELIRAGVVTAESLVWHVGMPAWAPAGEVPELSLPATPQPPPLPGQGVKPPVAPLESVEIKPRSKRNAVILACGCLVFVLGSISLLADGSSTDRLTGIFGLLFFGGGGLIAIPKLLRRRCSLRLTPQGVEQVSIYGSALIPWADIEAVGTTSKMLQKLIGLRLGSYDRYLDNVSDELAGNLAKGLPVLKWLSRIMSAAKVPDALSLWSKLSGEPSVSKALQAFGKVGDLAELLLWNRTYFEYEVLLGWADMDRPAEELVRLLREQHAHYTG